MTCEWHFLTLMELNALFKLVIEEEGLCVYNCSGDLSLSLRKVIGLTMAVPAIQEMTEAQPDKSRML